MKYILGFMLAAMILSGCATASLHKHISDGNTDEALKMISEGKNLEKKDSFLEQTPLHVAAENGNYQLVKALLDQNVAVNARDVVENTPLHCAMLGESVSIETVTLLLDRGADINARSGAGGTPLLLACLQKKEVGQWEEQTKLVKLLLEKGANPNLTGVFNYSPLHGAASRGKPVEVVKILIKVVKDIDAPDKEGLTPYAQAARNDQIEAAEILLAAGARPRIIKGKTPEEKEKAGELEVDSSFYWTALSYRIYGHWSKKNNNPTDSISTYETAKEYFEKALKEFERAVAAYEKVLPEASAKEKAQSRTDVAMSTLGFIMGMTGPGRGFAWGPTLSFDVETYEKALAENKEKAQKCREAIKQVGGTLQGLAQKP